MKLIFITAALAVIASAFERRLKLVSLDNSDEPLVIVDEEGMLSIT